MGQRLIPLLMVILCACSQAQAPGGYTVYMPMVQSQFTPSKGVGLAHPPCQDAIAIGAAWAYSWSRVAPTCVEGVPMIWGATQAGLPVSGSSAYLLGFNEPDIATQANLTAQEAAALWPHIEDNYSDRLLVSPAPSHLDVAWLQRFRNAYIAQHGHAPRLDALAVHCYGGYIGCRAKIEQVTQYAESWNIEGGVWVTEFATPPCLFASDEIALAQARQLIQWMQAEPRVARYAWFANRIDGNEWWSPRMDCITPLFDPFGALTQWGEMYKGDKSTP